MQKGYAYFNGASLEPKPIAAEDIPRHKVPVEDIEGLVIPEPRASTLQGLDEYCKEYFLLAVKSIPAPVIPEQKNPTVSEVEGLQEFVRNAIAKLPIPVIPEQKPVHVLDIVGMKDFVDAAVAAIPPTPIPSFNIPYQVTPNGFGISNFDGIIECKYFFFVNSEEDTTLELRCNIGGKYAFKKAVGFYGSPTGQLIVVTATFADKLNKIFYEIDGDAGYSEADASCEVMLSGAAPLFAKCVNVN